MSSGGQIAGAIVGGVAGFFLGGGPLGALQGAALGAGIGAALDPPKGPTVEGPRLSDLSIQTSTYGAFLPRVSGTVGISGNIIWLENNRLRETVRKEKQGGKGGGSSTTVKTYSYSATFALALCEGEIAAVRRIWCSDVLIYNAGSSDVETVIASNRSAAGWRLYRGTDSQMPDPRYEANVGTGNASAFRGIAYIVFYDFALANYGNTLQGAQFKVEIISKDSFDVVTRVLDLRPSGDIPSGNIMSVSSSADLSEHLYMSEPNEDTAYVGQLYAGKQDGFYERIFSVQKLGSWESTTSYDGMCWGQYESTRFANDKIAVSQDGKYFWNTLGNGFMQFLWNNGTNYRAMIGTGGQPANLSRFAKIYIDDEVTVGQTSDIVNVTIGYCGSTAGESPFEFRIFEGVLSFKLLDENFSEVSSYGVNVSSLSLPNVTAPLFIDSTIIPYYASGVFYLAYKPSNTSLSIFAFSSEGLLTSYSLTIPSMSGGMSSFRMLNLDQGAIAGQRFIQWARSKQSIGSLDSVIENECALSSLINSDDLDLSLISQSVRGFHVSGGSIRSALEPLQAAFPFDVISSGYKIKFVPRGQDSVKSIPWSDLGAGMSNAGIMIADSREMDSQLPVRTNVKYLDAEREYALSEQYAERLNTAAVNRVDRELPLVLNADEAAGVAEVLTFLPWLERTEYNLSLPPLYSDLEPADVISVQDNGGAQYELRIVSAKSSADGILGITARPNRAALYTSAASGSDGVIPDGNIPLEGPTTSVLLDIPVVDETFQYAPGFVVAVTGASEGWPGATLFRSVDSGQTWQDLQGFTGKCSIGFARAPLGASACNLVDQRSLTVFMRSGFLESVTRDQMLLGANYAAYGVDGRWEIIRFQNAAIQTDGTYIVSGFVRGDRGTEWASGLHQENDLFIILADPDNAFIGTPVEMVGVERAYRAITSGDDISSAADTDFTYRGVNLECLSPVDGRGVRDGSGNFLGYFSRRSRLSSSWWSNGVSAPLGEAQEAYEIDVMNGSVVVRTISTAAQSFAYSAASQTSDFGSSQSSITFRIYQMSAVVGRGYAYEVTL